MTCRIIKEYAVGTTRPSLLIQLWSDRNEEPESISGKTIVFDMENIMSGEMKIENAAVVVVDESQAIVRYDFVADDMDTVGRYFPKFVIDKGTDTAQQFPNNKNGILIEVY